MAVFLKDRYYMYSLLELAGGILDAKGTKRYDIKLVSDGDFWKFSVDICGKKECFFTQKGSLKKYEIEATYYEAFGNYKLNGHCYMRPGMEVREGNVVVDGGGAEGFYARYALNMGASKVIICEPCAELAEGLKKTFEREIETGKIIIVEKALGRIRHIDTFRINQDMICASGINVNSKRGPRREIMVDTLDNILKELDIDHIDILKMDIEGAEMDAVIGARRTIRASRPKLIIATYHSYYNAIRIKNICKKIYSSKCSMHGCYLFEKPWRPYMTFITANQA